MKHTLNNLESISKQGESYFLRFECKVETTKKVNHPVFTSMGMKGKMNRSQVYKNVATVTGTRTEVAKIEVSQATAKAWVAKAHRAGAVAGKEDLGGGDWVLRINGGK